jgi:endoglucanase
MNRSRHRLLLEILNQPTAPFRERHVLATVARHLRRAGVPHFQDPHGNLVIGAASRQDYQKLLRVRTPEPLRLLVAHADHPGFHGLRWLSDDRLLVKWHGGSPVRHLRGSRVWLADDVGYAGHGEITRATILPSRHAIDNAELRVHKMVGRPVARELFGGFAFRAPVWQSGRRLYTKAADDLVGVFAVVDTAIRLYQQRKKRPVPFLGLITRGEEVGFVGVIGHLELGWLQRARRPVVVVSLETSRTLANAHIGKGPVVRLGDRRTVFDPGYSQILANIAERVLPGHHQRRIMDGGSCEATAAIAWGLPAIGISVPLGNYHNQGLEGGPGCRGPNGPAPEFVHLHDVEGLCELCLGLFAPERNWQQPWRGVRERLTRNFRHYRKYL